MCVRVCYDAYAHAAAFALDAAAFALVVVVDVVAALVLLVMLLFNFYGGALINRGFPSKARNFIDISSNGFL